MKKQIVDELSVRLDNFISSKEEISRSQAQKIIALGVLVNGNKVTKNGYALKCNDEVVYEEEKKEVSSIKPNEIKFDVIYEDDDILVINKPRGLVVHPSVGHHDDTLVNALIYHYDLNEEMLDEERPGIVHRIDKDTSGLLIVAKNLASKDILSEMIKNHEVDREYLALCYGRIKERRFKVDAPIARHPYLRTKMAVDIDKGREAVTHFEVVGDYKDTTLLRCKLETGRTHQIRVHLAYIGHPIVNDPLYCSRKDEKFSSLGQVLHAYKLTFNHPRSEKKMVFYAPLDEYFKEAIKYFVFK